MVELSGVLSVVNFLDRVRWSNESNYMYKWPFFPEYYKSLDVNTRALVHLLAYISNRMIPAERVWKLHAYNDLDLIEDYSKVSSPQEVDYVIGKYHPKGPKPIVGGISWRKNLLAIVNVLKKLLEYDRDLIEFLDHCLIGCKTSLSVPECLEEKFFDLLGFRFTKRIRCVIRDFKKWSVFSDLPQALSPEARRIWEEFPEWDLRLPSDRHVNKVLSNLGLVPAETTYDTDVLLRGRMIMDGIGPGPDACPERFDVLWQVGRDLCSARNCYQCPFGEANFLKSCPVPGELCPTIKQLFNWSWTCEDEASCPLRNRLARRSCKRV